MSAVAVSSSSSLNPDAPLFIPAALLQVEDFSPQWWDLVTTTTWFRDHWSRDLTHLDHMAEELDAAALLPDALDYEDLFFGDEEFDAPAAVEVAQLLPPPTAIEVAQLLPPPTAAAAAPKAADAVLKALNLASPKGGAAPLVFRDKPRHPEKPAKHAGSPKGGAPRVIHQPR